MKIPSPVSPSLRPSPQGRGSWFARLPEIWKCVGLPQRGSPLSLSLGARAEVRAGSGAERGVALVITLVLLSVITFMAIAFLVLTRGQRSTAAVMTDQLTARLATDTALERAQTDLLGPILATTNPYNFELKVSTTYANPLGFRSGFYSPTNVNYDYTTTGARLAGGDQLQNLANLLYDPRPPVFVTPTAGGATESRFYLDLNRNGRFETNGMLPVMNPKGGFYDTNGNYIAQPIIGNTMSNYFVGDPEWIGVLEYPDRPHSADNRFISRYAYIAIPVSKTLDVNTIHNQARALNANFIKEGGKDYNRNQGVGPWEINLASFLYDLNTNLYAWGGLYLYDPFRALVNGNSFMDAGALTAWRYNMSLSSLAPLAHAASDPSARAITRDGYDAYATAPPMTTNWNYSPDPDLNLTLKPWLGSDNTNHFFTLGDFFDPAKVNPFNQAYGFPYHLRATTTNISSYDRYTFYRMIAQLGTDSSPEPPGKMNLNYDNLVQSRGGVISVTNYLPWQATNFFTQAANRLLTNAGFKLQLNLSTSEGIQVYPTNLYTPSVHRLMQLAANIYDSVTNRSYGVVAATNGFPTVFMPIFKSITVNGVQEIRIVGYRELANSADHRYFQNLFRGQNMRFHDPARPASMQAAYGDWDMVSGIPLIIGAKKGFPNFNEFSMQSYIYAGRLLEFRRPINSDPKTTPVNQTNQMYVLNITNSFGLEAWNSYASVYPRPLQLISFSDMTANILATNDANAGYMLFSNKVSRAWITNLNTWASAGTPNVNVTPNNFVLPYPGTNNSFVWTNGSYVNQRQAIVNPNRGFEIGQGFYVPHWWLNMRTQVRFLIYDAQAQRIIDFVNLDRTDPPLDIMYKLQEGNTFLTGNRSDYKNPANQWITNRLNNANSKFAATYGIQNQILACINGDIPDWTAFQVDASYNDKYAAVDSFRYNLLNLSPQFPQNIGKTFYKSNVFYAPLIPYRPMYINTTWEANDPLVHYTVGDLVDVNSSTDTNRVTFIPAIQSTLGQLNNRYQPWGRGADSKYAKVAKYEVNMKDPVALGTRTFAASDDWDFPTNKLANVGWLGRVHRGTPWQTIFFKAATTNFNMDQWQSWSGNPFTYLNVGQFDTNLVPINTPVADALFSTPTNDWRILDLFTTAINDNASRGQLSVNQTNLAAWSAVLGGVNVLYNSSSNTFIRPAFLDTNLANIVSGITRTRNSMPGGSFRHLGDILATPELTVRSPYVLQGGGSAQQNDAVYERIPQQILGLLKGEEEPRFLIYSYGQTLKPAERSLVTTGPFVGLCTNYQVTAEVATRAVVRIDPGTNNWNRATAVIESFNVLPPD